MDMKRNILATLLALAAVVFSCTPKEEAKFSDSRLVNDGSVVYNPTAEIRPFEFEGGTKTVLTIDETYGAKFTFVEGDLLGIYPYFPEPGGDQMAFSVKSITEETCTFNGGGFYLSSGYVYAAYYPLCQSGYGDVSQGITSAEMMTQIPLDYTAQVQSAKNTFDISAADYMLDNGIEPVESVCSFKMRHLGALLVMDVTFPEAGTFTELSLNGDGASFLLTGVMDVRNGEVYGDQFGAAVLALGTGNGIEVAANETVRFCMMVSPVDFRNASDVTLTLKDDQAVDHSVSIARQNYKAGYAYKIECTLNVVPVVEPTNLSLYGTANTYIVDVDNINADGYYFNATVAGNGVAMPDLQSDYGFGANIYPSTAISNCAISGTWAKVMLNQNNCISDVSYSDGTISFKATGNEGNAKITLVNGADDNDNYVWTWIIWCTDQPGIVKVKDYWVLDRNIGATTNAPDASNPQAMYGLYYEFGNPIGYTSAEYSNADKDGNRMYDALARMPNKPFIAQGGTYWWFNPWTSTAPKQLFGRLWGSASAAIFSEAATFVPSKVLYDPCPVGYKVAPYDFFNRISLSSRDNDGGYVTGTDGTLFFPFNGAKWKADSDYVGEEGYYEESAGSYMYYWTSAHNNTNMAFMFTNKGAPSGWLKDHILTRGMGVRCVR